MKFSTLRKSRRNSALRDQVLRIMKLVIVIMITALLQVSASSFGQRITLSQKKISLKQVLKEIRKQSNYSILCDSKILQQAKPVDLQVKDATIQKVLDDFFINQPFAYTINENTIIINRKPTLVNPFLENAFLTISGKLTDEKGQPLVGVSVMVKSTKLVTQTDATGAYSIVANKGDVLVFTYIGFGTQEITVGENATINVTLKEAAQGLSEVVVTALGIKKSTKSITYNLQAVDGEQLTVAKDANFVNSLNGRIAGATINASSSGVGGSARVILRGVKSLTGNNNALYVVDGIPLPNLFSGQPDSDMGRGEGSGDGITNINPDDIESISVLTGASAAALYGSQAANGVILVTTKKGVAGKTRVNFSSNATFSDPFVLPELQNTYGTSAPYPSYISYGAKLSQPGTYKVSDFFQTGSNYTNAINVSTGSEKNQSYFSVASVNAKGIVPTHQLNRYNFTARNNSTLIADKLTLDVSAMYLLQDQQNPPGQGRYQNPLVAAYLFPSADNFEDIRNFERFNPTRNFNTQYWPYGEVGSLSLENPFWVLNREISMGKRERFLGSAALKYTITPELNLTGRVKYDNTNDQGQGKQYASTLFLFAQGENGNYNTSRSNVKQTYADLLLNYTKQFNNISVVATAGASIVDNKNSNLGSSGPLSLVPNFFSVSNIERAKLNTSETLQQQSQTQAVFASATFGYKQKLFLEATVRNDWSSGLAFTESSSIIYPSVGLSAIVNEWVKLPTAISYAKVRASYSEVGNAPQAYLSNPTFGVSPGSVGTIGAAPFTTLKPERTNSFETGIDLKMFQNKLNASVTYYNANTINQLFSASVPAAVGVNSYYINAGKVNNYGIEATVGYNAKFGALNWNPNLVFSLNRNKIKQLLPAFIDPYTGQLRGQDTINVAGAKLITGGTTGDVYSNGLQKDANGNVVVDADGLPIINRISEKVGSTNPNYNFGFNNIFNYKNFSLNVLVTARLGGIVTSQTQAMLDTYGMSEKSAMVRDNGGVQIYDKLISAENYYGRTNGALALYAYSATNVRLAELSFGYSLPAKIFKNKIQSISLAITARNLWMIYNKAPNDPESTASTSTFYQGYDHFNPPSLRNIGFKLNVSF